MDKKQLCDILQVSLLYFEGMQEKELINLMPQKNVKIGINLTEFLKNNLEKVKNE